MTAAEAGIAAGERRLQHLLAEQDLAFPQITQAADQGAPARAVALGLVLGFARRELQRNDLGGKTGTTNEGRDTWFVGFNANIVGAAWVGFDSNRPLGASEQGARTALPMWISFMREALAGTPERRPKRPPGIVEYRINPKTGLIAPDGAPDTIFEKFDIDNVPERETMPTRPGW